MLTVGILLSERDCFAAKIWARDHPWETMNLTTRCFLQMCTPCERKGFGLWLAALLLLGR